MANTTVATANRVEQWAKKFFSEYTRATQFSSQMGTGENAVIQVLEDLTKERGDRLTVPLVRRLSGNGVVDDATLEGNEESLSNYGHQLTLHAIANAVRVAKMERIKSPIDLLDAARDALKTWIMSHLRDSIIDALMSPVVDGITLYADASEVQKDAWSVANSDRILFGNAVSNYTGDHSVDLAKVDATTDVGTAANVSLVKRIAKLADPHIAPIKVDGGSEWFVYYMHSYCFRDFKSNVAATLRDGWERGKDNPLFKDGDIIYDGVIVKEVPEIPILTNVGDGGTVEVAPAFLCGAQAVGLAWGQRSKFVTQKFDYERQLGVALDEVRGVEKLMNNSVQNGVVTCYLAAVAD